MWNFFGVAVFHTSMVNWRRGGTCALRIYEFCYMLNIFGVVVLHRSMVSWKRGDLGICAFSYMWNLFSQVVFQKSRVNLRRRALVYVHSAICETSLVLWYSIHLWSVGGGYICPKYKCSLLCVKHIQCSVIPYIYGQLEEPLSGIGICAFCYMWNFFGVVVFHGYMINWRGYICPKYECILLYVKLIQSSGIP